MNIPIFRYKTGNLSAKVRFDYLDVHHRDS
jgi:hypothetical protein